jgi:hypothetical protein
MTSPQCVMRRRLRVLRRERQSALEIGVVTKSRDLPPESNRRLQAYNGSHVIRSRRLLAIVCIAVVVVTALTPATVDLSAVLVALDPLFGALVTVRIVAPDHVPLAPAPYIAANFARPPPLA